MDSPVSMAVELAMLRTTRLRVAAGSFKKGLELARDFVFIGRL